MFGIKTYKDHLRLERPSRVCHALISRQKTWVDNEVLLYTDLNNEFNEVFDEFNGNIDNANIKSAAGIVYSKLSLTNSILNADINSSAAIAYSKLNLATSIVNADVSGSAAIAYSKLNLATSIVNADISASAAIAASKLADVVTTNTTQTISGVKSFSTTLKKPTSISIQVAAGTTNLTTGDGKFYFVVPPELDGMVLTGVFARVITAGTTGTTDIQFHNVTDAVDILSTKLTIDSTETSSATAATAAVINTSNDDMATNDLIRIDVDAVSTTAPKGLIVRLTFGI